MGGHGPHLLGWTVLALVIVAYAHVILELAAAGLALAIATRILTAVPWTPLVERMTSRRDRPSRSGRDATADQPSRFEVLAAGREVDPPGDRD